MFFNKKNSPQPHHVQIAFHQHLPESKILLIYNMGKSSLKDVSVTLINETGENYTYTTNSVSARSNELIYFGTKNDINGKLFTGNIVKVVVKTLEISTAFKPNDTFKFNPV